MSRRPLFLFSLPRSGSTLVQRVLASHDEIATAPEPWVLLPQLYATRGEGVFAEYGYGPSTRAIREFVQAMPRGQEDYDAAVRAFVLRLYERASGRADSYFLDKTPRYHLVAREVLRLFPDAKAIFLWRNPLAVVASIVDTWAHGRWSIGRWNVDLYEGLTRLILAYRDHADRVLPVRFEELVGKPESSWPRVFAYLDLPFDPRVLKDFGETMLEGGMGDPTGSRRYRELSTEPLDKWKRTLANPLRKAWCNRYLRWIGGKRLAVMGYDLDELLAELETVRSRPRLLGSDFVRMTYGWLEQSRRDAAFRRITAPSRW